MRLSNHIIGHKSSPFVIAKEIFYNLVASDKTSSSKKVAQVLGVDRMNIERAMENHSSLNINEDVFWLTKRSKKRGDALNDMAIQQIMDYWTT